MKTRADIINDALRIRAECKQIIIDTDCWNKHVLKPHQYPIDPDPNDMIAKTVEGIERMLQKELLCVHVNPQNAIYATTSLQEAEAIAADINAGFEDREDIYVAVVAAWPETAEEHAHYIARRAEQP